MSKAIVNSEPMAYVSRDTNGGYHTVDLEGNESEVCSIIEDGRTIVLKENVANRHFAAVKKVNEYLDAEGSDGLFPLYPRETTTIDTTKIPVPTWAKYLDETDNATLMEILTRANDAKLAAKAAGKVDGNNIDAKIAKKEAELAKLRLLKEAAGTVSE